MKTVQRFYMPYMNQELLSELRRTGTVTDTEHYSMFEYDGPLELVLFDRHYSVK
jgi:hypothetical protein